MYPANCQHPLQIGSIESKDYVIKGNETVTSKYHYLLQYFKLNNLQKECDQNGKVENIQKESGK